MKVKFVNKAPRQLGFSLIELMIVVAVIGLLSAIALPSYSQYIKRGKRAEARSEVLKAGGWLERYYTENNRYSDTTASTVNAAFTSRFSAVPSTGAANYNISLTVAASSFTVTAAPTGSMSGDDCGSYTLTNTGSIASTANNPSKCLK